MYSLVKRKIICKKRKRLSDKKDRVVKLTRLHNTTFTKLSDKKNENIWKKKDYQKMNFVLFTKKKEYLFANRKKDYLIKKIELQSWRGFTTKLLPNYLIKKKEYLKKTKNIWKKKRISEKKEEYLKRNKNIWKEIRISEKK